MDKQSAWEIFRKSGKIADYLKFREIANEAEHRGLNNQGDTDG